MNPVSRPVLPSAALTSRAAPELEGAGALIARAEALGVPWQRLLRREIDAEITIRAFFVEINGDWPIWAALEALPFRPLQSWRVRDRLEALSSEARSVGCLAAIRALRAVFRHLSGKATGSASAPALARHLWFAYHRVLVLQRISRAAYKIRGDDENRIACVMVRRTCSRADAEWAVHRENGPGKSHLLDDAMRKAREEGFEIPHSTTEARAFRKLRGVARSSPHLVRRAPASSFEADTSGD